MTMIVYLALLGCCFSFIKKARKHTKKLRHSKKVDVLTADQTLEKKGIRVLYGFNKEGKLRRNMVVKDEMNIPLLEDCSFTKTTLYPLCLEL